MDAARYARVRELFLAADELPVEQQESFVRVQAGGDVELLQEVLSLLGEHDPESARIEGERAAPPITQSTTPNVSESRRGSASVTTGQQTTRGDVVGPTQDSSRKVKAAEITQLGAQRTHASPRDTHKPAPPRQTPSSLLWAQRTRQSRRRASSWLWLAALVPTALIGWWTYRQVESTMRQAVANELQGVADTVAFASRRYLADKAQLVESWSRQPVIQTAINELVVLEDSDPDAEALRSAEQTDRIRSQLQQLSGFQNVKFVIWNDSYRTIASSQSDLWDVGSPVDPGNAANLARVMAAETVVLSPQRVANAETEEEFSAPVMAVIVPVSNPEGRIIAALLVRGIGMYDEFNRMFMNVALAGELDAYAVNQDGIMMTDSPRALAMAATEQLDAPKMK